MVMRHLTDAEIQEYALDHSLEGTNDHIHTCPQCAEKVAEYRSLFSVLKEQGVAAFDFDLAALVLPRLPGPAPAPVAWLDYLPILIISFFGMGAAYIFRSYLVRLFGAIIPVAVYLIAATVITALTFLCIDMYKGYRKKMHLLDMS